MQMRSGHVRNSSRIRQTAVQCYFKLPPRRRGELRPSGLFTQRVVANSLPTLTGQPIGSHLLGSRFLILEFATDRLSRNVGK